MVIPHNVLPPIRAEKQTKARDNQMTNRDFSQLIGNTPLIRLNHLSNLTGCEILGKAEFMNPGGSVKDRAAKAIIEAAEKSGAGN